MLISTALLLDSIIRNSVCTPAKLPCRRVEVGYEKYYLNSMLFLNKHKNLYFSIEIANTSAFRGTLWQNL
jgi:hypothetical protein